MKFCPSLFVRRKNAKTNIKRVYKASVYAYLCLRQLATPFIFPAELDKKIRTHILYAFLINQ